MSSRVFFSLALFFCLAVTFGRATHSSYASGSYLGYGPRDEGLRQVRRCPTCPPDCPDSLASPWYGSPTVYGQPVPPFEASDREHQRHSVTSARRSSSSSTKVYSKANQAHPRDSLNPYGYPHFAGPNRPYDRPRCSCTDGHCNSRHHQPSTTESASSSPESEATAANPPNSPNPPNAPNESFENTDSFDSEETGDAVATYYPQSSSYGDSEANYAVDDQSQGSHPPYWNDAAASYPSQQHPTDYENNPGSVVHQEQRHKAIETPSHLNPPYWNDAAASYPPQQHPTEASNYENNPGSVVHQEQRHKAIETPSRSNPPYWNDAAASYPPQQHPTEASNYENNPGSVVHENQRHKAIETPSHSNPPYWNDAAASYPPQQHPTEASNYENPGSVVHQDQRLRAIETPSRKKVFVVYRADAASSCGDDDLDEASQQQHQQHHHQYQQQQNPMMTDSQLEEVVRRAVAAATRRHLCSRHRPRGISNNEHERYQQESYDQQRRPYNDALYHRFNAEEAIDRQQRRKHLYRTGYRPSVTRSEMVYHHDPNVHYNPYAPPGENNYQRHYQPPNHRYFADERRSSQAATLEGEEVSSDDADEGESDQPATILDELRDISEETSKNKGEEGGVEKYCSESFATKREADSEEMEPPPINYRTAARTATEEQPIYGGGVENEGSEEKTNTSSNSQETKEAEDKLKGNPDLMEDMEIPPIGESEVELQLSYESPDNSSTPPPN